MSNIYDLIIIGGGPAGSAAAVYAARKRLKTAIIAESFGGQSIDSLDIQNWIGTISISGLDLAKNLKEHVKAYTDNVLEVKEGERVEKVEKKGDHFLINNKYETRAVLITTGGSRRKLEVPGAEEYDGKGIVYCASCDAPLFGGKDVAVIGGGNAGFEAAAQLTEYATSITLLSRGEFRADAITISKVLSDPKVKAIKNAVPIEIKGSKFVEALIYKDKDGAVNEIPVQGVFVEIGNMPATGFVKDLVKLDAFGKIIIDHKTQRTSTAGIWAAGDCTDGLFHQNNIAAGDAVKALEDIYIELHKSK
jgi:NADH-dependent peroxiredoxin subunit F